MGSDVFATIGLPEADDNPKVISGERVIGMSPTSARELVHETEGFILNSRKIFQDPAL